MARVSFMFQHNYCFHILISLSIILTNALKWFSSKCAGIWLLGPGFDSQVPQTLVNMFSNIFICNACPEFHHATSQISFPSGHKAQSNGHGVDDHHVPSQSQRSQFPKVNRAWFFLGLRLLTKTSIGSIKPPWFYYSFYFLSFFYFLLTNYYYYYY